MADSLRRSSAGTVAEDRPPLADPMIYLVVFLGGCLGTGMRYGLSLANAVTSGAGSGGAANGVWSAIHLGTFTANMVACFIYAALSAYMSQARWIRKRSRELVSRGFGMGMCGGLSTMSTLAFEQFGDLAKGNVFGVLVYVVLSFGFGILFAYLGVRLALALTRRKEARVVETEVGEELGSLREDPGRSEVAAVDGADKSAEKKETGR